MCDPLQMQDFREANQKLRLVKSPVSDSCCSALASTCPVSLGSIDVYVQSLKAL